MNKSQGKFLKINCNNCWPTWQLSFQVLLITTMVFGFRSYNSRLTLKTQCHRVTVLVSLLLCLSLLNFFRWIFKFFLFYSGRNEDIMKDFQNWILKRTDFKSEIQNHKKKWILNPKSFQPNDLKSKIRILKNSDFKSSRFKSCPNLVITLIKNNRNSLPPTNYYLNK